MKEQLKIQIKKEEKNINDLQIKARSENMNRCYYKEQMKILQDRLWDLEEKLIKCK